MLPSCKGELGPAYPPRSCIIASILAMTWAWKPILPPSRLRSPLPPPRSRLMSPPAPPPPLLIESRGLSIDSIAPRILRTNRTPRAAMAAPPSAPPAAWLPPNNPVKNLLRPSYSTFTAPPRIERPLSLKTTRIASLIAVPSVWATSPTTVVKVLRNAVPCSLTSASRMLLPTLSMNPRIFSPMSLIDISTSKEPPNAFVTELYKVAAKSLTRLKASWIFLTMPWISGLCTKVLSLSN